MLGAQQFKYGLGVYNSIALRNCIHPIHTQTFFGGLFRGPRSPFLRRRSSSRGSCTHLPGRPGRFAPAGKAHFQVRKRRAQGFWASYYRLGLILQVRERKAQAFFGFRGFYGILGRRVYQGIEGLGQSKNNTSTLLATVLLHDSKVARICSVIQA